MIGIARLALCAAAVVATTVCQGSALAQSLKVETGNSAGLTTLVPQLLAKSLTESGVTLLINSDQTLTRSAMSLGIGRIDAAVVPPPAFNAMQHAAGPYKKAGDSAKEAAANIRSLFPFAGGVFHPIVWADSGIDSWDDMKGKRIFIGPPAGAANRQITGLIRLAGGLEEDTDYTPIRLGWGAAIQAFQDGQFDVLVGAFPVGAAAVQQLGLQREIRLIGVSEEVRNSPEWAKYLNQMGELNSSVAPGTYDGQVNGDETISIPAYAMVFGVNKDMDDDLAYSLTKTYWDSVDGYKKSVAVLAQLPTDDPLAGNNVPLHPGAARYYEEQGIEIPAAIVPPAE
ncbi:TAXI family TRAP transporter solute-binding subunit [uncultured Roseibium sp.]|uniref:TAXI family TRAP transporter solute-binding subunit n=1 Tax=uncultured Roseibium sp. TaxID=1936171 RepID=UPI0026080C94|nr:TAXI family TRAP transporter solute-binding subunit [uncultured Roseibium sp.]